MKKSPNGSGAVTAGRRLCMGERVQIWCGPPQQQDFGIHSTRTHTPGALAVAGRARSGLVGLIPARPPQQHGSQQQQDRAFCDERRVGVTQVIEVVMADCHVGDVDHAERALRAFTTARPHYRSSVDNYLLSLLFINQLRSHLLVDEPALITIH